MRTIFVIDDDLDQAELLGAALESEDRRIRIFSNPIRALHAMASEGADVLIADVSMPWVDGAQILETARKLHPRLRTILVSGYPRGEVVARRQGVAFFAKPISLNALRERVDHLLSSLRAAPSQGQLEWPNRAVRTDS